MDEQNIKQLLDESRKKAVATKTPRRTSRSSAEFATNIQSAPLLSTRPMPQSDVVTNQEEQAQVAQQLWQTRQQDTKRKKKKRGSTSQLTADATPQSIGLVDIMNFILALSLVVSLDIIELISFGFISIVILPIKWIIYFWVFGFLLNQNVGDLERKIKWIIRGIGLVGGGVESIPLISTLPIGTLMVLLVIAIRLLNTTHFGRKFSQKLDKASKMGSSDNNKLDKIKSNPTDA